MRLLTQLLCGWEPAIVENKCMQRTEPCPEQHMHIIARACFKSHCGPASIPNDLRIKATRTIIFKTVYI